MHLEHFLSILITSIKNALFLLFTFTSAPFLCTSSIIVLFLIELLIVFTVATPRYLQLGPQASPCFLHPHLIIVQPLVHPQPLVGDSNLTSAFLFYLASLLTDLPLAGGMHTVDSFYSHCTDSWVHSIIYITVAFICSTTCSTPTSLGGGFHFFWCVQEHFQLSVNIALVVFCRRWSNCTLLFSLSPLL